MMEKRGTFGLDLYSLAILLHLDLFPDRIEPILEDGQGTMSHGSSGDMPANEVYSNGANTNDSAEQNASDLAGKENTSETAGIGSEAPADGTDAVPIDGSIASTTKATKISTSGPRTSRRSSWRQSKGMSARPERPNALNKQGAVPGRRKAGRSHRRR